MSKASSVPAKLLRFFAVCAGDRLEIQIDDDLAIIVLQLKLAALVEVKSPNQQINCAR